MEPRTKAVELDEGRPWQNGASPNPVATIVWCLDSAVGSLMGARSHAAMTSTAGQKQRANSWYVGFNHLRTCSKQLSGTATLGPQILLAPDQFQKEHSTCRSHAKDACPGKSAVFKLLASDRHIALAFDASADRRKTMALAIDFLRQIQAKDAF